MALALDRYLAGAPKRTLSENSAEDAGPYAFLSALPITVWLVFIGCAMVMLARVSRGLITPSHDEGELLVTGHRILDLMRSGTPLTDLDGTAYSGAPGLYPLLAAFADDVGGLGLVRDLSLAFTFIAMIAVYALGREVFGRTSGILGAAAFALTGSVIYLSQWATFDALALAIIATAAWLAAYSARFDGLKHGLGIGTLLAVAVIVKYSAVLFVAPVIALAVAIGWFHFGWYAVRRGAIILTGAVATVALAGIMWAREVPPGIWNTTWDRHVDVPQDPLTMLLGIALWIGPLAALALLGAGVWLKAPDSVETIAHDAPTSTHPTVRPATGGMPAVDNTTFFSRSDALFRRQQLLIIVVMFLGALVAPAAHVVLHDTTSLTKHLAFSAIFLAPLAGDYLSRTMTLRMRPEVTLAIVLTVVGFHGTFYATDFRTAYPSDRNVRPELVKAIQSQVGKPVLSDMGGSQLYYFRSSIDPSQWHDLTRTFAYNGKTDYAAFAQAASDGYFGVIYTSTKSGRAQAMEKLLDGTGNYQRFVAVPQSIHGTKTGEWHIWTKRS